MSKCGKGCMPECEYFTTGGCISPFNCPYKIETGYINSATSIPTYMERYNGMSDTEKNGIVPYGKVTLRLSANRFFQSDYPADEIQKEPIRNLNVAVDLLTMSPEELNNPETAIRCVEKLCAKLTHAIKEVYSRSKEDK